MILQKESGIDPYLEFLGDYAGPEEALEDWYITTNALPEPLIQEDWGAELGLGQGNFPVRRYDDAFGEDGFYCYIPESGWAKTSTEAYLGSHGHWEWSSSYGSGSVFTIDRFTGPVEDQFTVAAEQGFVNAEKRDSQDICFVPDGDYARVIELHTGKKYPEGQFVDLHGNVLGRHKGIIHYTIGQRKGLGLALPQSMYVCEKRLAENEVVLGLNEDLFTKELDAEDFNWIAYAEPPEMLRVKAKVRYKQTEQWATVHPTGKTSVHLTFDEPQRAITKGQAVVLYDGDVVVGGGTIL